MLITAIRSGKWRLLTAIMLSAGLSARLQAATPEPGPQPPAQAFADCKGKQDGEAVQITTPDGKKIAASCVNSGQGLYARPTRPPMPPMPPMTHDGGTQDGRPQGEPGTHGHPMTPPPPPQAFADCKGKKDGEAVQISTPDGTKIAASCVNSGQGLFARPARPPMPPMPPMSHDDGPAGAHGMHGHPMTPPPPPQAFADCKGKKEGEVLQISTPDGTKIAASCVNSGQGLFARPAHPPMPPMPQQPPAPSAGPAAPAN